MGYKIHLLSPMSGYDVEAEIRQEEMRKRYEKKKCLMNFEDSRKPVFDYSELLSCDSIDEFVEYYGPGKRKTKKSYPLVLDEYGKVKYKNTESRCGQLEKLCDKCEVEECEYKEEFSHMQIVELEMPTCMECPYCDYVNDISGYKKEVTKIHDVRVNDSASMIYVSRAEQATCARCGRYIWRYSVKEEIDDVSKEKVHKHMSNRLVLSISDIGGSGTSRRLIAQGYGLTLNMVYRTLEIDKKDCDTERKHQTAKGTRKTGVEALAEPKRRCISKTSVGYTTKYLCYVCSGDTVFLEDLLGSEYESVMAWIGGEYGDVSDAKSPWSTFMPIIERYAASSYPYPFSCFAYRHASLVVAYAKMLRRLHEEDGIVQAACKIIGIALRGIIECWDSAIDKGNWERWKQTTDTYINIIRELVETEFEDYYFVSKFVEYLDDLKASGDKLAANGFDYLRGMHGQVKDRHMFSNEELKLITIFEEKLQYDILAAGNQGISTEDALFIVRYANPAAIGAQVTKGGLYCEASLPHKQDGKLDYSLAVKDVPVSCLIYLLDEGLLDENRSGRIPCAIDFHRARYGNCKVPNCGHEKCLRWINK